MTDKPHILDELIPEWDLVSVQNPVINHVTNLTHV